MVTLIDVSEDAAWKRRLRAWRVVSALAAPSEPACGIAAANRGGVYQIHAWDVASGALRPLTFRPSGKIAAWLSPDARYVYSLDDEQGNEIGDVVRVPYEGGEAEDVTAGMPPYALAALSL